MAERFSAFSFVDRITKLEPGVRAAGRYAIPAHLPRFPACLVAEAIGQLAAWVSMSKLGFRRRPVAGLAAEMLFLRGAVPGDVLDLAAEIETCDEDAVAYGGTAHVSGQPVLELRHCVGPMLPMGEFDAPEAVSADFAVLCDSGAPAGRIRALPQPEVTLNERVPGKSVAVTLHVPAAAPFFGDHFPRRPVFPGTLLLDWQIDLAVDLAREASGPGRIVAASRVIDMKMRSFIGPGQGVGIRIELQPQGEARFDARLTAQVDGKAVATARVEIVART